MLILPPFSVKETSWSCWCCTTLILYKPLKVNRICLPHGNSNLTARNSALVTWRISITQTAWPMVRGCSQVMTKATTGDRLHQKAPQPFCGTLYVGRRDRGTRRQSYSG